MRTELVAITTVLCLVAGISNHACANVGDFFYGKGGNRITVPIADSLVLVKHNPAYTNIGGHAFIAMTTYLTAEFKLLESADSSYLYHLADGNSLTEAIIAMRSMDQVDIINPVLAYKHDTTHLVYCTDEFFARYHESIPRAIIDSLNEYFHVEVVEESFDFETQYLLRITAETGMDILLVSQAYYESGLCFYVQPNFMAWPILMFEPDDAYYTEQWHLQNTGAEGGISDADIDADSAWEITFGEVVEPYYPDVIIAVIDAGYQLTHEDLEDATIVAPYDAGGFFLNQSPPDGNPIQGCYYTHPDCWHGTAVAGLIFSRISNEIGHAGLAPGCDFMPIKMCDDRGASDVESIARSFRHARRPSHKANIISCSWRWPWAGTDVIEAAIDTTYMHNIAIFFAAGNSGFVDFPAYLSTVTAVGATNRRDSIAGFSGRGSTLDLVAPGVDMVALDLMGTFGLNPELDICNGDANYTCHRDGTSYACPQVAATAGLVRAYRKDFSYYEDVHDTLQMIMCGSAEDQINPDDPEGWDQVYGHGRLNAFRALLAVGRGDIDSDGSLNPVDVVLMVDYVYKNWPLLALHLCLGDCNCDGAVNPVDLVILVNHVYKGHARPQICFDYMED